MTGKIIREKNSQRPVPQRKQSTRGEVSYKSSLSVTATPARKFGRNIITQAALASGVTQTAIIDDNIEIDNVPARGDISAATSTRKVNGIKRNKNSKKSSDRPINSNPIQEINNATSQNSNANKATDGKKGAKRLHRLQQKAFRLQQLTSSSPSIVSPTTFPKFNSNRRLSRFPRAEWSSIKSQRSQLEPTLAIWASPNGSSISVTNNTTIFKSITVAVLDSNNKGGNHSEHDVVYPNPDLCYKINGLSGGQQKICAQHITAMPAISRGARAAIQMPWLKLTIHPVPIGV